MSSSSSMLRLALVVLVCATGLTAAQGYFPTCPSGNSSVTLTPSGCTIFPGCLATFCTCTGGTANTNTQTNCSWTTAPSCATTQSCYASLYGCVIANSIAGAGSGCGSSVKMAALGVASGANYTASGLYQSCTSLACNVLNYTVASNCSSLTNFGTYCGNPISTTNVPSGGNLIVVVLVLSGGWTAVLANSTAVALLNTALTIDIEFELGYIIIIVSLRSGTLIVTFDAQAAANDQNFINKINAIGTDSSWLTHTKQVWSQSGGTGTFGVIGISTTTPIPASSADTPILAWTALLAAIVAMILA